MPYGEDVAVVHASAGMRRVIALAYLLTWAWQEHVDSAELRGEKPTREIIFLVDEIEGHLHPQWQRRIVPALLNVMDALTGAHDCKVQLLTATHSPLVLASVESEFDADQDAWFDLDLQQERVVLSKRPYVRHGEIGNWLTSEAFDLREPRSLEGERAISAAKAVLDMPAPTARAISDADDGLRRAGLPDIDSFWVSWSFFMQEHGVARKPIVDATKPAAKAKRTAKPAPLAKRAAKPAPRAKPALPVKRAAGPTPRAKRAVKPAAKAGAKS
jgi:hypothetical protein